MHIYIAVLYSVFKMFLQPVILHPDQVTLIGGQNEDGASETTTLDSERKNRGNVTGMVCSLLVCMLVILFQVFVLYALVAANTLAVSTACGSSFWNFMFSRFLLVFIELIIMGVGRAVWHKEVEDDPIYHSMKQVCFLLVLRIIYISLGAVYVKDAMDNGRCTTALSHASFTNTPLLGILGYFYLVLDSLSAMLSLCACCSMMVIFGSDASNVSQ